MFLEIKCPSCGNQSQSPFDRVPGGKLKTTCNGCGHQFVLNKERNLNCQKLEEKETTGKVYGEDGWQVDLPGCQGIGYDLVGLNGLINTGMLTREVRVQPPAENEYIAARHFIQLKAFFEKYAQKEARRAGR